MLAAMMVPPWSFHIRIKSDYSYQKRAMLLIKRLVWNVGNIKKKDSWEQAFVGLMLFRCDIIWSHWGVPRHWVPIARVPAATWVDSRGLLAEVSRSNYCWWSLPSLLLSTHLVWQKLTNTRMSYPETFRRLLSQIKIKLIICQNKMFYLSK